MGIVGTIIGRVISTLIAFAVAIFVGVGLMVYTVFVSTVKAALNGNIDVPEQKDIEHKAFKPLWRLLRSVPFITVDKQ